MAPPYAQQPQQHSLSPTLKAPQRHHGATEDQQVQQQAGRSATNLNAQASAATIREASRPSSREGEGKKKVPEQTPTPALLQSSHNSSESLPHTPAIPSPLNPSRSSSSGTTKSLKESDGSVSVAAPPSPLQKKSHVTTIANSALTSGAQTPSQPLLRRPEMSQLESPRSVRDLGSDYTRYFNPFATQPNSAGASQQDLSTSQHQRQNAFKSSTHLAPPAAISSTDLAKRLSNPFKDDRRISASIISERISTPELSKPKRTSSNEKQNKRPIVAAASILPTRAGTPAFIHHADPEKAPFFQYPDDRLSAPCAFPLYIDQQEEDDDMHMPHWDDDKKFKPTFKQRFSRDNILNTIGMVFLVIGLLTIFIVLPVVSFTGTALIPYSYDTPLSEMGYGKGEPWAHVNDVKYPLLENVRTGLIDPDTPSSAMTRKSVDGDDLVLVFSDEFDAKNRTFYEGDDPFWFAPDIWYGATQDLEWYDPDAVNTGDGTLQLQLDAFQNHGLGYRSGMLNSWNQLCFKGGVFEVSISLPGPAGIHGLWPGAWTMGNLGRPGYLATTDGMWPYTYDSCDAGITPNQSMTDGTSNLPGQRLPNCVCYGEDHPTPGTGRGAPEIDIVEVSADWGNLGLGVATQSYQVAPFDIFYYPNYEFMETPNYNLSFVNTYTGGPYQQAVSTTTMLNNDWYDGKAYQKYAFEYEPGGGEHAHITWFVGEDEMMRFDGRAIGPNGNVQQRLISEEPMSMVLNLGFSHSWVNIDQANLRFPTVMRIDYVRWYQKEGESMVTCDPPGYETTEYIANHPEAYKNPNVTHWSDAGYDWPKNTLMHGCQA